MERLSDLRLSKSMKYTALYWAMRFSEVAPNVFRKIYADGTELIILAQRQEVRIGEQVLIYLSSHESFVALECINRLLCLGVPLSSLQLEGKKLIYKNFLISFVVWDDEFLLDEQPDNSIIYKSRLVSGVLEYKSKINQGGAWYDYGVFEQKDDAPLRRRSTQEYNAPDFIIEENRVMKYVGKERIVAVPEGIEELESSAFWDNQYIEEVILPESLQNMGGDTFYYCKNLRKINIPQYVELMGNNPFAGCPNLVVTNQSSHYKMVDGVLYTADMRTLIYCAILGDSTELIIPEGVTVISKHAFYCCTRFERIVLPESLEKMENNPFSGCTNLELINNSNSYYIQDDVIYNRFKTAVVGALNRIQSKRLILLDGIKTINRNSFWNCRGIETIVFPASLEDIGYNPFVDCVNIHFESNSLHFKVIDGVLYNKDCSKLICCPQWRARGEMYLRDSVITLERGAFSGCREMTAIHLHNVNIINKSCFTNCKSLHRLYCSDLITYIGEWAFAYCDKLKEVSIHKGTIVDNNAFSNCPAMLVERSNYSNYLVESDNIYTLQSMQKGYRGKIDSILIDPPYNSHVGYIGYKDGDYNEGYIEFMRVRLDLAYRLLSQNGFLVLNIDEGERARLTALCQTVFGNGFVSVHRWKKKHQYFDANRVVLNPQKSQTDYEYILICRKSASARARHIMQPYITQDGLQERESELPEMFDCFGTTSSAKDEIKELFGTRDFFSTPKPVKLMKELIRATSNKDSIIMDFFAGSGTVGQACVEMNREDGGSRKFVLVSNNESNICERITDKRLQAVHANYVFMR